MALDALVDSTQLDSDLTSVANKIRQKSGGSSSLAFPSGFVSEIGNISGGGWVKTLSAVWDNTGLSVLTTDALDDLRDRLTVTATYMDDTSETVTGYALSGTLTAGTSTLTVTYGDKQTTFTVTVYQATDVTPALSAWVASHSNVTLVKNETDGSILAYTTSSGTYRQAQITGLTFDEGYGYRFSADVEYFAGTVHLGFSNSNGNVYVGTGIKTASGHYVCGGVLSESSSYTASGGVRMFITWSTSQAGRAVFRNIKLVKYSTTTPEQALNLLAGE